MRYEEFTTEEERMDEILPLIPAIAGGVARAAVGGVGGLVGKAAGAVARGAARAVGNTVGTVAKSAYSAVTGDKDEEEPKADPNAKVGTQPATPKDKPQTSAPDTKGAAKTKGAPTMGANPDLKQGKKVTLPTNTPGGKKSYKVTKTTGDEVEIEDPTAKPGEPSKMTYKKQDLERAAAQ